MQPFFLLSLFASALAQQDGVEIDLQEEPFLRGMIQDLERLQVEMNLTATAEPEFETGFFRTQNMKAAEEALVNRMVQYSGAAYCLDLTLKSWSCRHCHHKESVELVAVETDVATGGKGYIAVDHAMKTIVVAFRGSANLRNWMTDLDYGLVDLKVSDGTEGIRVHNGFLRYTDSMSHKMAAPIRRLLATHNYTLTLTGHSLGGAVATLSGIYLNKYLNVPWSSINLVTFGEPRVGNEAFARWFNAQNAGHLRVVNNRDMVVHLPLAAQGFVHRKREIFIGGGGMQSCTADELEDPNCGASKKYFLNIWDHVLYQGIAMGLIC